MLIIALLIILLLPINSFSDDEDIPKPLSEKEIKAIQELRKKLGLDDEFKFPEEDTTKDEKKQPAPTTKPTPKKDTSKDTPKDTKKDTPTTQPPKPIKTEQPKPKDKDILDKILDFLFGDPTKRSKQLTPTKKEDTQIEPTEEIISRVKEAFQEEGLDKIIQNAIENSPDVKKARIEAEIVKRQNTFTPVPQFNVGNDLATGKAQISAGFLIPLEPLFTGKEREKHAKMNIKQKEYEVIQRVIEQQRKINTINQKIKSIEDKLKHAKQIVSNTEEQYKTGLIKIDEVIKAKELLWNVENEEQSLKLQLIAEQEKMKLIESGGK